MEELLFEWNKAKNTLNIKKHGVSFEEASGAFYDEDALIIPDPDHSKNEERFLLLGYSLTAKLLVVSHCYRSSDNVIRLISARKASKGESEQYYCY